MNQVIPVGTGAIVGVQRDDSEAWERGERVEPASAITEVVFINNAATTGNKTHQKDEKQQEDKTERPKTGNTYGTGKKCYLNRFTSVMLGQRVGVTGMLD